MGIGVKALLDWVQERLGRNKEGTEDWLYRLWKFFTVWGSKEMGSKLSISRIDTMAL